MDDEVALKPDEHWMPCFPKGWYMPQYRRKKAQVIQDCLMVGEDTELRRQLLAVIWK